MTKLKSKKITKSTFAIIIMAIALIALLAFGGTYAYFTATANKGTGEFTTGKVSVSKGTVTVVKAQKVVPTEQVISGITFTNDSNVATYLLVKVSATYGEGTPVPTKVLNLALAAGWQQIETTGVYYKETSDAAPETGSVKVCDAITFNADVNYVEGAYDSQGDGDLMGQTFTVTIEAAAVQKTGFDDAKTAAQQVKFIDAD